MDPHALPIIPDIPGVPIPEETAAFLKDHVSNLCGTATGGRKGGRFPGSQPVSFTNASIKKLQEKNFWVCEKSDGVRVILLILLNGITGQQETFLLDRKDTYRQLPPSLYIPHHDPSAGALKDTILDGELVLDVNRQTGKQTLRYYAFDCLVYHGVNLMKSGLQSRYGRLRSWVVETLNSYLRANPGMIPSQPFQIIPKKMELAYAIPKVLHEQIPLLEHGHDGLIFTCVETGYVVGTDGMIMKWKPPHDNTIDFRLNLRFPPLPSSSEPDFGAEPMFLLYMWDGGREYVFFDEMEIGEGEWDQMKASSEQLDNRIIECRLNPSTGRWCFMRFRDDKPHGNHRSTVESVLDSIRDGVGMDELVAAVPEIRARWKERNPPAPPPPGHAAPLARAPQVQGPPVTMLRR